MGADAFVDLAAVVVVPVENGRRRKEADAKAYIDKVPVMSTSQALGTSSSPIVLMVRQVAQPKLP